MKRYSGLLLSLALIAVLCTPGAATTYEVGPGKTYTNINDVPLESLSAGDTVKIYHRTTPYKEKWVVCAQGTESNPVTFEGVPGTGGELPIIDGDDATTRTQLSYWSETRCVIKFGESSTPSGVPTWVVVENLDIKSARPAYDFTDDTGSPQTYSTSASSVWVVTGRNITFRNCIFRDSGNGFFTYSTDSEATGDILVEGCYMYDNGIVDSIYQHNNYTESQDIIFQYNHLGPLRTGCPGNNLKDRSSGQIVRYNWIESGNRQLDLVNAEDSSIIRNDADYDETWVYGNILIESMSGNRQICHYGGDTGTTREGTLYFYNNTVVSTRTDRNTLFRVSSYDEDIDARNNVIYTTLAGSYLEITSDDSEGPVVLRNNWIKSGYTSGGASVTSYDTVSTSSPGFVNESGQDYHLTSSSDCIDEGTTLHANALPVSYQYVKHQDYEARPSDSTLDIGAYEYGSSALAITTTSLPDGTVSSAYSQTVSASGGATPYSWSVVSGSLPAGLSLASSTGVISGTPTTAGTSNFTVRVTDDDSDTDDQALSITVNYTDLQITTTSLPGGTVSQAYSQTVSATGGKTPYTWSVISGSVPAGLSLASSTGVISGTPTTAQTANFTVRATDNQGTPDTDDQALSITISSVPDPVEITTTSLPGGTVGSSYSQTVSATGGVTPYSWSVVSGALPAGLSLSSSTGAITGTPTTAQTANFTVRVTDDDSDTDDQALSITVNYADVQVTTTSLPGGTVDVAYSQTVQATGGKTPYSWSVVSGSLPAGLSLASSTGTISGTPTTANTYNFTVRATDDQGTPDTDDQALSITVSEPSSGATYEFSASDSESTTSSSTWQTKVTLNFNASEADDWLILAFADNSGDYWDGEVELRMQVDSTDECNMTRRCHYTDTWFPFTAMAVKSLSSGSHTVTLQYRSTDSTLTAAVKNARIIAVKKDDLSLADTATDTETSVASSETTYATLNWTPSSSGSYLLIHYAEFQGGWQDSQTIKAKHSSTILDTGEDETRADDDWMPWMSFNVISCDTSQQTATLTSQSSDTCEIRRRRIVALRLSGGPFAGYAAQSENSQSSTTSTSWQQKLTKSFDGGSDQDWLILASARLSNSSTGRSPRARIQLDNSTTLAEQGRYPVETSQDMGFNCIDVRELNSTSQFDVDFTTSNASGTAYVEDVHFVALPLQSGGGSPPADLEVTTTSLPDGTVDVAYSQTVSATGGTTPYSWSVISGSLPAGLSLASSTGAISGTPTTAQTANFTVRVTDDDSDTDDQALSITIDPEDLVITTTSLPDGTEGVSYSQTVSATGGVTPYSWSVVSGSLPAGLSLASSTGIISGTPTTAQTANFTVRATDDQGTPDTDDQALSITINADIADLVITTTSLPDGQVGVSYSQTVSATGGVTPYGWSVVSGSLPAGLSLASSTGVISGTPTAYGTSNFTVRVTDDQGTPDTDDQALSITIDPADLQVTTTSLPDGQVGVSYNQTVSATGGATPYSWSVLSGSLPAGLSLASSTGAITGTPTAYGTSNFTVRVTDDQGTPDTDDQALSITIDPATLQVTTTSLPGGTVSTAYSQTVQATGGVTPYSWSVLSGSLPAGLSLASSTGVISGTPTTAETANFTVRVTDDNSDTDDQALSITVSAASTGATYEFAASDTESSTTSATWQTKVTLNFNASEADDWLILAFADNKGNYWAGKVEMRIQIDSTDECYMKRRIHYTNDVWLPFTATAVKNLSSGSHTITLQYRSTDAGLTAYVRRARIIAIKKDDLSLAYTATDAETSVASSETAYVTLNWTPSTSGDYLLIHYAEFQGGWEDSQTIKAKHGSTILDAGEDETRADDDWVPWMSFNVVSCDTSQQTATLTSLSSDTCAIRRRRIVALRLSGGSFADYESATADGESTTTSTSWQQKLSKSFDGGSSEDWLILAGARKKIDSSSDQPQVRLQMDDTTDLAGQQRVPVEAVQYMGFNCIDVRELSSTTQFDVDYRTDDASTTARIKYVHFIVLPLE